MSFQCICIVWFGRRSLLLLICLTARSIAGRIPALFHPLSVVFISMNPPMCRTDFSETTILNRTHMKPVTSNSMMQTRQRALNSISILIWYAAMCTRVIIYLANHVHFRAPDLLGLNYFATKILWAAQMSLIWIQLILTSRCKSSLLFHSRVQLEKYVIISTCSRTYHVQAIDDCANENFFYR